MPERDVIERARRDAEEGKSPSTQAGEFVREEIAHVREGKHGVRSAQQVIAIGLSKARRAGVKLPPPKKRRGAQKVRRQAKRALSKGRRSRKGSAKRSRAISNGLPRESRRAVSHAALSRQARSSARRLRGAASRGYGRSSHQGTHRSAKSRGESGENPPTPQLVSRHQEEKLTPAGKVRASSYPTFLTSSTCNA